MKNLLSKVGLVAMLGIATAAVAEAGPRERDNRYRKAEKVARGERQTASGLIVDSDERYVMVTGSNVPQKVRRRSIGTDGAHNVRIFTQRELQTINGGFGVGGIALDPSVSISGR